MDTDFMRKLAQQAHEEQEMEAVTRMVRLVSMVVRGFEREGFSRGEALALTVALLHLMADDDD